MDTDTVEIECPVCDHKVRGDAPRCPHCGAEFALSDVDELERVARELNGRSAPEDLAARTGSAGEPTVAVSDNGMGEEKESKGLFGKLFRKRR